MSETTRGLVAALEERLEMCSRATPGPWRWDETASHDLVSTTVMETEWGEYDSVLARYPKPVLVDPYVPEAINANHIAANDPPTVTLLLTLALAATRRRQAWSNPFETGAVLYAVDDDVNAALDALEAHVCGGEGAS